LDHFMEKFVRHFEVFFEDELMTTNNSFIVLNVAACSKNYTVTIRCVSVDGYISPNVTYHTNMRDDEIPLSSLENRIKYEQMKEAVTISWFPIKEEESCIAHYEINFNDNVFKTNETQTIINDFAPCITYDIDITPVSIHLKYGMLSTFEFTSKEFCKYRGVKSLEC
jgi:hypothetical protein